MRGFKNPSRILIKAPNWIGDILMASFALRALKRDHPEARLTFFCRDKLVPLTRFMPWIDDVISHGTARSPVQWGRWIRAVSHANPDAVVLCANSFKAALLTRLGSGAPQTGLGREGRSWLLKHAVDPGSKVGAVHRSRWYTAICQPLLKSDPDLEPALRVTDEQLQSFSRPWPGSDPVVAMAVGAAFGPSKEYGVKGFLQISDQLTREGYQLVIVGTPREAAVGEVIREAFPNAVTNMAGKTTLDEMVLLLACCDGYVGNDSGPMHVAAVLGKPTVGIYGPTDPAWVGPVGPRAKSVYAEIGCSPCYERICPKSGSNHMACMTGLRAEDIVQKFLKLANPSSENIR